MKVVVSYQTVFSPQGTVYNQRLRIDYKTFELLRDCVQSEISQGYNTKDRYVYTSLGEYYLKPLQLDKGKIVFMNTTQTRFINLYLKCNKVKFDRNVCLIVD